jgi:hypothetical protein
MDGKPTHQDLTHKKDWQEGFAEDWCGDSRDDPNCTATHTIVWNTLEDLSERSWKGGAALSKVTVSPSADANILQAQFIIRVIRAIRL